MSLRYFSVRLYKNGRFLLQAIYNRSHTTNILENSNNFSLIPYTKGSRTTYSAPRTFGLRKVGYQVGLQARKLFIDNVLNRVTNCVASELRSKATRRLIFGDAAPFFALIGVSLASGAGVLSREDEQEGLCLEIRDAISKFQWNVVSLDHNEPAFASEKITLEHLDVGLPIGKGCSGIIYSAKIKDDLSQRQVITNSTETISEQNIPAVTETHLEVSSDYPLALKMMFNYDIQSNSLAIERAMYRETIPARRHYSSDEISSWKSLFTERNVHLPPHPNIVAMYSVFADFIPQLLGSMAHCPDALPSRINPEGYGRNMSLFLVMKRYQYSLAEYLKLHKLKTRDSVLLLAQLLEGVTHINLHGIAHRDLKSDNILVDALFDKDETVPVLVITDFGCCLADHANGLQLPYNSDQIDKGGNAALMAPEIVTQTPGTFSVLNYSKADLWAVGTIAYEIFGSQNPFYRNNVKRGSALNNMTYSEKDLPKLDTSIPKIMKLLIKNLLSRNPNKRLQPEVAANVCQLYLWAPSDWLKSTQMPSSTEILQWLLCLTTKVLCESRLSTTNECMPSTSNQRLARPGSAFEQITCMMAKKSVRRTHPEYVLISSFLGRTRLTQIKQALTWIQDHNY